jgi:alkaline phosphatase D
MISRRGLLFGLAPAFVRGAAGRPTVEAVTAGDPLYDRALIWARGDRASKMLVHWGTTENGPKRLVSGPEMDSTSDFTSKLLLRGLPEGQTIFYEVQFEEGKTRSEPVRGRFKTPSRKARDVRFAWSGDVVGQGYGISPDWGGLRGFESVWQAQPDFFIHSGDTIYADGPIQAELKLPDGTIWRNLVTEEKSKVAETLAEFRGAYKYNLKDNHFRKFLAEIPQVWQWDDHETLNNWSSSTDLSANNRYKEKDVRVLAGRAKQAFREYSPIPFDGGRIHRHLSYGPLVDVFVLDMRSFRGPNTYNRQTAESTETSFLGAQQMEWFQKALRESKAVWKVIAADMPIGLLVPDGKDAEGRNRFEAIANGDGPPLGRELETARLLRFIKQNKIRNTVWFTADVHYTAAHHYSPERAAEFKDFDPFWEFVSGPLHAGSFGPGTLENTFGPELQFAKHPPKGQANLPPSAGYQFFGDAHVDAKSQAMRVVLRDLRGTALYTKLLEPAKG